MQKAAKEKVFLMIFAIASVLFLCAPSTASSTPTPGLENRVELFLLGGENRTEPQAFESANRVENYDSRWGVALESPVAPNSGYLNPGIGSAAKGQIFNHAWIKHDLFNDLRSLVGKADANKFLAALKKGIVGPTNQSGIKIFSNPVGKYTHELKISGSAQRILGYIDDNGVLIFDKFVRGGLH